MKKGMLSVYCGHTELFSARLEHYRDHEPAPSSNNSPEDRGGDASPAAAPFFPGEPPMPSVNDPWRAKYDPDMLNAVLCDLVLMGGGCVAVSKAWYMNYLTVRDIKKQHIGRIEWLSTQHEFAVRAHLHKLLEINRQRYENTLKKGGGA